MKNQIVFLHHDECELWENLGISEERAEWIRLRAVYFCYQENKSKIKVSEAIENTVEGLNPNETVLALFTISKIANLTSMIEAVISPIKETSPIIPVGMIIPQIVNAFKEISDDMLRDSRLYETLYVKK